MGRITSWMDGAFYPNHGHGWDHHLFRDRIWAVMTSESVVLDLGAGRGAVKELDFRGRCKTVAGVDPDDAVLTNPHLDEAMILEPPSFLIPYPDETFDIVLSSWIR